MISSNIIIELKDAKLADDEFDPYQVTHVIVPSSEAKRTQKVLEAIAYGKWILSSTWVSSSIEAGKWKEEAPFQTTAFPGAKLSRQAHGTVFSAFM